MAGWRRRGGRFDWRVAWPLLGLLLVIIILWNTWLVYPLKLLVVFFHELSHGLMALLTGGRIHHIALVAQEGGLCVTEGGSRFLILNAGYLGSLLWGAALLLAAVRTRADRAICVGLGSLLLLVALLWVRPVPSFGFFFALVVGAGLVLAGTKLSEDVCDFLLKLVGLTSILYAPLDIFSDTLARAHLPSDARLLAELTHIPTVVWGALWIMLALVVGVYSFILAARVEPAGRPR